MALEFDSANGKSWSTVLPLNCLTTARCARLILGSTRACWDR